MRPGAAKPSSIQRRVALLGAAAILLQAMLFGWHHHPMVPAPLDAPPVAAVAKSAPPTPATAEDSCEICAALHHLSAAPGEFVAAPVPRAPASGITPSGLVLTAESHRLASARAPPSIEISA